MSDQPVSKRGENRSQRPTSEAFRQFITSGWGPVSPSSAARAPQADAAAERRRRLGAKFPTDRLVIPAGGLKVRSNDTDYRFRPHSAFAHLTGLGTDQEPDAVLVLNPPKGSPGQGGDGEGADTGSPAAEHEAVLYFRPASTRTTEEFYSDSRYGEFWVGRRPSLEDVEVTTGIRTAHLDELRDALAKDVGEGQVRLRVIPGADESIAEMVHQIRRAAGVEHEQASDEQAELSDDEQLAEATSELRLVKDAWEVEQMRLAVDATREGFEQVIRSLPRAVTHRRGERVVEAAFDGRAREEGNAVGYETIAAAGEHATTLHWIRNDGQVRAGELLLLDAGVEVDSLYTADITRTLPVDGHFTRVQWRVYSAVLEAADAAFAAAVPGARFRDVHEAAMVVIARKLAEWGLLPVSAEESLAPEGQYHRRWMVHGTSHHLGLDVHDCAQARAEMYLDGILRPGMVFTIEPGLYFKADDAAVPEEYRGIGCRIEDDVLITETGNENLSAAIPRTPDAVEEWMAGLRG